LSLSKKSQKSQKIPALLDIFFRNPSNIPSLIAIRNQDFAGILKTMLRSAGIFLGFFGILGFFESDNALEIFQKNCYEIIQRIKRKMLSNSSKNSKSHAAPQKKLHQPSRR
jgi:uncharacterized membrane protein YgaE (UPF0421/DUF939 family)